MEQMIKLCDIREDGTLQIRKINKQIVGEWVNKMKLGIQFPPMLIDGKSKKLIDGFHRIRAYQQALKVDDEVSVIMKDYKDEGEMILDAYSENNKHGFSMSTFDNKKGLYRLRGLGISENIIQITLGISNIKIKKWDRENVIVIVDNEKVTMPIKKGNEHLYGQEISKEVYEDMDQTYSGWNVTFHVNQILKRINDGTIDKNNEEQNMALAELRDAINIFIKKIG